MQEQPTRTHHNPDQDPTHQPHDEIHVVSPSWQPLIVSFGLALTLAGIALTPIMWIVGIVISIIGMVNWLTELRRDYRAPSPDDF
jgi:hypothetical protein